MARRRTKRSSERRRSVGCRPGYFRSPKTKRCVYRTGNKGRKAFGITYKRSHKREGRPSPQISASSVPIGTVMRGHDGNSWQTRIYDTKTGQRVKWIRQ